MFHQHIKQQKYTSHQNCVQINGKIIFCMFIFIEICMKGDPLVRIKGKQPMKSVLEVGNVQMVGWSEAVNRRRTDNTMAKRKGTKG
jgi:hypothetical protein